MNNLPSQNRLPDYFAAQFPGGGQRGYATAKLLEWFEEKIDLPTHQFFPYVTAGSVGILIVSALYLPHPDHPNAARMTAKQLVDLFPHIAARMPQPAKFKNKNSREPFADAIRPYIGHGKLKDLLGTVFFSSHKIGELSNSYVLNGKIVCPRTGKVSYIGDPHKKILDIAFAGTSLPSLFPAYENHIDMAFAENAAESLLIMNQLFPPDAKGAFVRVGNFRSKTEKSRNHLYSSGYVQQAASFSVNGAVSDHCYSQTIGFANRLFQQMVFNLEYEIGEEYNDPPEIKANVATQKQFERIDRMIERFILDNMSMMTYLAETLKVTALKRMHDYPATAFDIPARIQEFPIEPLPVMEPSKTSSRHAFGTAAGQITRVLGNTLLYSAQGLLQTTFDIARSERVTYRLSRWGNILLPPRNNPIKEGAQPALPPIIHQHQDLL